LKNIQGKVIETQFPLEEKKNSASVFDCQYNQAKLLIYLRFEMKIVLHLWGWSKVLVTFLSGFLEHKNHRNTVQKKIQTYYSNNILWLLDFSFKRLFYLILFFEREFSVC
jgi:hypothetical protein